MITTCDHDAVRVVTLRPTGTDAYLLDQADSRALGDAIADFCTDPHRRALIVAGTTDTFCEGTHPAVTPTCTHSFGSRDPGKPVIAAVEGRAAGVGLEIVAWCDFCVAGQHARFSAPERSTGRPCRHGATQRLPRIVGLSSNETWTSGRSRTARSRSASATPRSVPTSTSGS